MMNIRHSCAAAPFNVFVRAFGVLGGAVATCSAAPASPPRYQVDVLEPYAERGLYTIPAGLSTAGVSVGTWSGNGKIFGWAWNRSSVTLLRPTADRPGAWTAAYDVNNAGAVVGIIERNSFSEAAIWVGGEARRLEPDSGEARFSSAWSINDAGDIVGVRGAQGVMWRDGEVTPMALAPGMSSALPVSINNAGVVAGYGEQGGTRRLVRWTDGAPTYLENPIMPTPYGPLQPQTTDMNERGDVVAFIMPSGRFRAHGYVWRGDERIEIAPADFGDSTTVFPSGINDDGWVVGYAENYPYWGGPFLWVEGEMFQLSRLVDPAFKLLTANKINNDGTIMGTTWLNGAQVAVRLTPIPAPGGVTVLGALAGALSWRRRR